MASFPWVETHGYIQASRCDEIPKIAAEPHNTLLLQLNADESQRIFASIDDAVRGLRWHPFGVGSFGRGCL